MNEIPYIVPISDLQKTPGTIVAKTRSSGEATLITQRGRPTAVLLSSETYEQLLQQHHGEEEEQERLQQLLQELEKMLHTMITKYKPERVILFGSLAKGKINASSDIDLVIIKQTKKRPLERQKELVHLLQPTVATDFFVYTPEEFETACKENRRFFSEELEKEGKVLYEKAA